CPARVSSFFFSSTKSDSDAVLIRSTGLICTTIACEKYHIAIMKHDGKMALVMVPSPPFACIRHQFKKFSFEDAHA
ncbi:MAG TPA: hypothetical protein VNZ53_28355, partial [Steroidobacteraceae bacterium]|nr:hypothetical protein [Steroidobacteraceae bacterium]